MSKLMKWSGSKDSQAKEIIKHIPIITNYYEPFVGGGSVFLALLELNKIKNYYISDLNEDLINIYNLIKNEPLKLTETYNKHYIEFNNSDIEHRKNYYYKIRKQYNENKTAEDFYWIMRTTTNGLPRYNKNKQFNNSCHFSRPGMEPNKVKSIILYYNELFNLNNINFYCSSYDNINIKENSILYCDPPYQNTKGMYFNNFDNETFINWLNNIKEKWILSYDGKVKENVFNHIKPNYKKHLYLESGNSSFRRVIGNSKDSVVFESLYLNY